MIEGLFAFLAHTTITWVFVASFVAAIGWGMGTWVRQQVADRVRRRLTRHAKDCRCSYHHR